MGLVLPELDSPVTHGLEMLNFLLALLSKLRRLHELRIIKVIGLKCFATECGQSQSVVEPLQVSDLPPCERGAGRCYCCDCSSCQRQLTWFSLATHA